MQMQLKMNIKLIASIALFSAISCVSAFGLDFTHTALLENSGTKKYKAVHLTAEVYNNAQANLADLMLFDKNNEAVPYFIHSFTDTIAQAQQSYDMKQIDSFIKDKDQYFDFTLRTPQTADVIANSLAFTADRTGFAKEVELWGGYDGINWTRICKDLLYDVDGNQKLEIQFDDVLKYPFYRLKLSNNQELVAFPSATLKYNTARRARKYFTATLTPKYTIEQSGNNTLIKLAGLKNLKLCSLELSTNDMFKRNVAFDNQSPKQLYHLEFGGNVYQDLTLRFDTVVLGSENSSLLINNNDDKPIRINGIKVEYLVDELVFDGSKSNSYLLKFGNSSLSPKNYDIASYSKQILEQGYDVVQINAITKNVIEQEKPQFDYKLIFNITVVAAAVVMGVVLLLRIKK